MNAEAFKAWAACMDIAKERGLALWCDDIALRLVAQEVGVPTFGTFNVLADLLASGTISAFEHSASLVQLLKSKIGDATTGPDLLLALLVEDPGNTAAVLAAIRRPSFWSGQERRYADFVTLMRGATSVSLDTGIAILYSAVSGLVLAADDVEHGSAHASRVLAMAVLYCNLSSESFAQAVAATRQSLHDWSPHSRTIADEVILTSSIRLLVLQLRSQLPADVTVQYLVALSSALEDADRAAVSRELLRAG